MKKHIISVSKQDFTRCSSCSRHHQIERGLNSESLLSLECNFCGGQLIGGTVPSGRVNMVHSRTSRLAMGLLGASLTFSACQKDETIEEPSGGSVMMMEAGEAITQALYGATPAGEMMAGEEIQQPAYGSFASGTEAGVEAGVEAGIEAGIEAGTEAGVEMMPAGDDMAQPDYGSFPAGDEG